MTSKPETAFEKSVRQRQSEAGKKRVPTKGFGHPNRRALASEMGKIGGAKSRKGIKR